MDGRAQRRSLRIQTSTTETRNPKENQPHKGPTADNDNGSLFAIEFATEGERNCGGGGWEALGRKGLAKRNEQSMMTGRAWECVCV